MVGLITPAAVSAESPPVIHEFFEYPAGSAPSGGGDLLPEPGSVGPTADGDVDGGPLVWSADGPLPAAGGGPPPTTQNGPSSALAEVTLDRETGPEGVLRYRALFEPSVAPWKRSGARDTVRDDGFTYSLVVGNPTHSPVPVGGEPGDDADRFRATLTVVSDAVRPVPVPAVSPEMAFHRIESSPPTTVEVTRDGAGNHFVWLPDAGAFELEMHVSAPQTYFGGPLPDTESAIAPTQVPRRLAADAARVLAAAGVAPGMSDVAVVERLLAWFRDFEARPFPADLRTDNLYLDVALGRIGVCRHRSTAFVMTALAAGVPARYVYNEAHAFVEVRFGAATWRRFDLGGAAEDFRVLGGDPAQRHSPAVDPTLSQSPAHAAYSNTLGDQAFSRPADRDAPEPPRSEPAEAAEGGSPPSPAAVERPAGTAVEDLRLPTRLVANLPNGRVHRGDGLDVRGTLTSVDGTGIAGADVGVWIGPVDAGSGDDEGHRLSRVRTDGEGRFAGTITVPRTLAPGPWAIHVSFAGDDEHLPSHAR